MSWADTQAVIGLVQSVPALAGAKTFPTIAPVGPQLETPYCVVHPSDGSGTAERLTGAPVTRHPSFTLHIVSGTVQGVQTLARLVEAKFVDASGFVVPPTIAGRHNYGAYWRSPIPLQTDTDVSPPLVYQVIELGWTSDPTPAP